MNKIIYAVITILMLSGCGVSPNKQKAMIAESIGYASDQIDRAERNGWITNEREDELQNRLLDALGLLSGNTLVADVVACSAGDSDSECIDRILLEIEQELQEKQQ